MAKNKGKNNNYQTETRRAADLIAKHEEAQRSRHKMLPHRLTTTEKKHLKLKTTQIICIILVVLLVMTSGVTAIVSILFSEKQMTAADYLYPPLFLYEDVYYMVTSEQLTGRPEGESSEELTAVTTGDQNTFPVIDGSCNFGGNTVPFLLVDDIMYCCTKEGIYLKCTVFDAKTDEDTPENTSSDTSVSDGIETEGNSDTSESSKTD